jgi:hypothetical protein
VRTCGNDASFVEATNYGPPMPQMIRESFRYLVRYGGIFLLFLVIVFHLGKDHNGPRIIAHWFEGLFPSIPYNALMTPDLIKIITEYSRENIAVIIYVFFFAVFVLLFHVAINSDLVKREISEKIQAAMGDMSAQQKAVDEIKNSISSPKKETIKIAIFDNLLAYAPLYVAQGFGYFEDELLDVRTLSLGELGGDDAQVAARVKSGEFQFGICDPIYCIESSQTSSQTWARAAESPLRILLPIGKRLGATVFGRIDCNTEKLKSAKKIRIATYKAPSTTYCVAHDFRRWLFDLGINHTHIELIPLEVSDPSFREYQALQQKLTEVDFIVLWEPQTSWVLEIPDEPASQFGVVLVSTDRFPPAQSWKVSREKDEISRKVRSNWKPWLPSDNRHQGWHKNLASALLTTEYMVQTRPELCRRVFRSISRALVRLENLDWTIEQTHAGDPESVLAVIADHINIKDARAVRIDVLKSLIGNSLDVTEGRSIFPFIEGIKQYEPRRYREHLQQTHRLWKNAEIVSDLPPLFTSINLYTSFFVDGKKILDGSP